MNRLQFKFNFSYPLTLLGAVLFLILAVPAFSDLWTYYRLTVQVSGTIDRWKVIEKSSSSFPLKAFYHFEFQEKTYQGSALLKPPYYLNRPSAEKAMDRLKQQSWRIWIDPKNPSVSAPQKAFPLKKIIYMLTALGVACYFGFLETHSKIRNPIK